MKNRIDIRALLNIYEKIKKHGQTIENGSQLEDIRCMEDQDGYRVSLADDNISLDIEFHNSYHFHTIHEDPDLLMNQTSAQLNQSNESQIQVFLTKLEAINAKY